MKNIRRAILDCLYDFHDNDKQLIKALNEIIDQFGRESYSTIFHVLTHLELSPEEAEPYWQKIIEHRQKMSKSLGREVNLRTAVCDYFCSISKTLKNPIVVEIHIFEKTFTSAKYDNLTGLYNRNYFDEAIYREASRSTRYDTEFSILFLDLDDFKQINDTYGHLAGDTVLKEVSEAITEKIRSQDIAARYGGEEIVIILPETGKVTGLILAERIREMVENLKIEGEGEQLGITVSGGLASFPIDATGAHELVKFADTAMFRAKGSGKNSIVSYSENKRRYIRFDFSADITVRQISLDSNPSLDKGHSKDLSMSGILFSSSKLYDIGSKIQIQIPFPELNETIDAIGTVVRTEFYTPEQFDIGVSFLEMDGETKSELSKYIAKQLEGRSKERS
jgi:diguanylate cyclase (GGDEF)-like protein